MAQSERPLIRMATLSDLLLRAHEEGTAREVHLTLNRIYFLDIRAVRQMLGHRRWLAKRAVVHGAVRSCIRRVLDPADVSSELSEDQYTIIFHDDDREAIAARSRQLAAAIEHALFGQSDLGHVTIRDAATVLVEGLVGPEAEDATARPPADAPALAAPPAVEASLQPEAKTSALLDDEERAARRDALLKLLHEGPDDELGYAYVPMWHVREGRIATYICRPRLGEGADADLGYAVLGHAPDAAAIARLDTHALEECLFALKRLGDDQGRVNLLTSVHFETLASRASRSQLQEFLAAVPKVLRRQLVVHVAELPGGIPEARLNEITASIAGRVRNLVVEIPMSECPTLRLLGARAWQYARARVGVVSFDFEGVATEESLQRARRVAAALVPRGLQLSATNVPTGAALCELATSDFAYLGGAPVGGLQPSPEPPRPFTMRELERFADPASVPHPADAG